MEYSNLITVEDFFDDVDDYVILKLPDEFPNYFDHNDIDILCKDKDKFLAHILKVSKEYEKQGFQIKINRKENGHLHIDFYPPKTQRLNLRFDLLDCFPYKKISIDPQYSRIVLDNRIQIERRGMSIWVPLLKHDLAIRFFEYFEYGDVQPDKIKHLRFIKKLNNFSFVDIVNKYTNLKVVSKGENEETKLYVTRENIKNSIISEKDERIDYFLIWGHGLQYTDQILDILRKHKDFEIIFIVKKSINDIGKFVDDIYSCDTYPLRHLVEKTRYLLKTKPEIVFILVRNKNPKEILAGSGAFRGVQCQTLIEVKKHIREKFNPKTANGESTHNHVIHASDYESQVEHVLKVLGLQPIEFYIREPNPDLDVPYHIEPFSNYLIKEISINNLYAYIIETRIIPIEDTPHYKYLVGDKASYKIYHKKFFGKQLKEDHSSKAFDLMIANFKYDFITEKGKRSLILVTKFDDGKYRIIDGVHRAAILKSRGIENIIVAEVF